MAYVAKREYNLQPFSSRLIPSLGMLLCSYLAAYWVKPIGTGAILAVVIYFIAALPVVWTAFLNEQERSAIVLLLRRLKK